MTLPASFERYDELIDLLVEALVRETEQAAQSSCRPPRSQDERRRRGPGEESPAGGTPLKPMAQPRRLGRSGGDREGYPFSPQPLEDREMAAGESRGARQKTAPAAAAPAPLTEPTRPAPPVRGARRGRACT
jgi:hypothetical protein